MGGKEGRGRKEGGNKRKKRKTKRVSSVERERHERGKENKG